MQPRIDKRIEDNRLLDFLKLENPSVMEGFFCRLIFGHKVHKELHNWPQGSQRITQRAQWKFIFLDQNKLSSWYPYFYTTVPINSLHTFMSVLKILSSVFNGNTMRNDAR